MFDPTILHFQKTSCFFLSIYSKIGTKERLSKLSSSSSLRKSHVKSRQLLLQRSATPKPLSPLQIEKKIHKILTLEQRKSIWSTQLFFLFTHAISICNAPTLPSKLIKSWDALPNNFPSKETYVHCHPWIPNNAYEESSLFP